MEEVEADLLEGRIGWLAETILENLHAHKLDEWICLVGLANDTKKLRSEIERVEAAITTVKGRAIGNRSLTRSLGRLRDLLYDADDVVDELDYFRLEQQVQGDAWHGAPESLDEDAAEQIERSTRGHIGEERRKRSKVWNHFNIEEEENGKATLSRCIDCHTVVKCGSKNGTSVLHNHRKSKNCTNNRRQSNQPLNLPSDTEGATNGNSIGRKRMRTEGPSTDHAAVNMHSWNKAELSSTIQQMTYQLQEVMSQVIRLRGSDNIVSLDLHHSTSSYSHLSTSSILQRKIYGRVQEKNNIIKQVTEAKSDGFTILPIVGIGGIGKTALAQFVYNDPVVVNSFQQRIWLWVSNNNFDDVQLTRDMLDFVCQENHERLCSFAKLQEMLMGYMKSKRLLLILDDVWQDMTYGRLNKLLAPLKSNDAKGNVILVTTRILSVAKRIGTIEPFELGILEKEDSWLLLKSCACGDENHELCASLSTIGHKIEDKLKGNPLAVETAGELLREHHTVDHWNNILKTEVWKSLQLSGGIMRSLERSYDHLPIHLQQCFCYCSLFPKGYSFSKAQLMQICIAQGFVEKSSEKLEQKGLEYLDELVNSGFFLWSSLEKFAIHDLMHDLARIISRTEYAIIDGSDGRDLAPTIRHLSIVTDSAYREDRLGNISRNEEFEKSLMKVTSRNKLRTLVLIGRYDPHFFKSFRDAFKEAKNLRLLQITATYVDLESFLSSLVNSTHLRYLRLENQEYHGVLPQALCKCYHLQVLDIGSWGTPKIPDDMNNLVSLCHLVARNRVCSSIANIGKMTSLQGLNNFVVRNLSGFEVTQLKSMNKLVQLGVCRLKNVRTQEEACEASLKDKHHLEKLSLSWKDAWNGYDYENEEDSDYENEEDSDYENEGLSDYENEMDSDRSSEPSVDVEHHIDMDTQIQGEVPTGSSDTSGALSLQHHTGMISASSMDNKTEERLPMGDANDAASSEHHTDICSQLSFSKVIDGLEPHNSLKHLRISGYNGAEPPTWLSSSLTCLQKLHLQSCGEWQRVPLESLCLLKKLVLIKMRNATELSIPSLEKLVIINLPKLNRCSCTSARDLNSSLRVLKIMKCPVLEIIPLFENYQQYKIEQPSLLSHLSVLTIRGCPNLQVHIPLPPSTNFSNLSITEVSTLPRMYMDGLLREMSIGVDLHFNDTFDEHSGYIELDDKVLSYHNLRFLIILKIIGCRNLTTISFEGLRQLTCLKKLTISNCPKLLSSINSAELTSEDMAGANRSNLPSLESLDIADCGITGKWLSLMLQHVQALRELSLHHCEQIIGLSIGEEENNQSNLMSATGAQSLGCPSRDKILHLPLNLIPSLKKIAWFSYFTLHGIKEGFAGLTSLEELEIKGEEKYYLDSPLAYNNGNDEQEDGRLFLPLSLGELEIKFVRSIKTLQICFPGNLTCLKKLHVWENSTLTSLQLHSCTALQELTIKDCQSLNSLEGLKSLSNLRFLKAHRCLGDHRDDGRCLLPQSLEEIYVDEYSLETLQPCFQSHLTCLKKLEIKRSASLKYLELQSCMALEELDIQCCLSLSTLEGLQSIHGLRRIQVLWAASLASLELQSCIALEELTIRWCESLATLEGLASLCSLKHLELKGCPRLSPCLESLSGQGYEPSPRLERLEIDDPSILTTSFCKHLTSLQRLELSICGRKVTRLTDEQERALQLLTSLQELQFEHGYNLIDFPTGLHSLPSLKRLGISFCKSIARLPEMDLPTSLEELLSVGVAKS
uniref:BED-type domain-containing protein n=1 Tax=Leersia perrieri TaxID=77586 RepID=A0A0D9W9P6_9ORYZ